MANNRSQQKKPHSKLRQLNFLVGKWHTSGEILKSGTKPSIQIKGMDTYEWINNGFFLLHRVDVFMGEERTEVIEIIGYDNIRKKYFMRSYDNLGGSAMMYATLDKPDVLKLGDKKMRSTLSTGKRGDHMIAKWERLEKAKWVPWMNIQLSK